LRRILAQQRRFILHRIEQLSVDPRRPQVEKLTGVAGYRLRVGDYRVLFTIDDLVFFSFITSIVPRFVREILERYQRVLNLRYK